MEQNKGEGGWMPPSQPTRVKSNESPEMEVGDLDAEDVDADTA